jgi:hypothetical protein
MHDGHYDNTDCPSYAGNGKCKFRTSPRCAYNIGNYRCTVNGNLAGKNKSKTREESEKSMMMDSVIGNHRVMG